MSRYSYGVDPTKVAKAGDNLTGNLTADAGVLIDGKDISTLVDGVNDHILLSSIGVNTHGVIDTHISATSGMHGLPVFGTIATQAANNVSLTGGSITNITDIAVADGGTGAGTAANARINLGVQASGTGDHTQLQNIGTNTHTQIDNFLSVKFPTVQNEMMSSRSYGVTYQNSGTSPMFLNVTGSAGINEETILYTGQNSAVNILNAFTINLANSKATLTGFILPSYKYRVVFSGTPTKIGWMEST